MLDKLTNKEAMDFINKIQEPFKTLPHLPKGLVEFFVKIAPYLALIGAVLGLISGPVIGLLGSFASLLTLSPMFLVWTIGTVVITLLNSVILFYAFNPLKNRQMKGWMLLFWSDVLSVISGIIGMVYGNSNGFIGTILGIVIGLYILFEMKPFYANKK